MDLNPPAGSKISVSYEEGDPTVTVPVVSSPMRYFGGVFLLFWLGMWTIGFRSAASQILSGNFQPFLIIWICGWTVGGVLAAYTLFRTFRPAIPETFVLKRGSVAYDSGVTPPQYNTYRRNQNPVNSWRSMFPKRRQAEFDKSELQTLRLRETDAGNRLTVDVEGQRVDLAAGASEVDREWLAKLMASRYGITQITTAATGGN